MKIKEVIEQTGLTDRSIRLYIANELITPQNHKSYTGRNNYDFTEEDVEILRQIALLRKADFSIDQIRTLQLGGSQARETIQQYLRTKREELKTGQQILSALETIPTDGNYSLGDICARIEEGLREKSIPQTDLKPGKWERFEKWIMRILSIPLIVIFGLFFVGVMLVYEEEFPFPKLYFNPINHIGVMYALIPVVLSFSVLVLYRKAQLNQTKWKKRRKAAIILMLLAIFIAIQPMGIGFVNWLPPVYSETDDPENYMVLGTYEQAHGDSIRKLFPATIPRSAVADDAHWYPPDKFPETTKYHYYHQSVIDPSFDIYAEWVLPEDEYVSEKQRIEAYFPEGPVYHVQWGDWVCLNYTAASMDEAAEWSDYYYLIFAYNDQQNAVRYIASYAMATGDSEDPYFLSLSW